MLSQIGPRYPLMVGENIVPFGYAPGEPIAVEQAFLVRHGIDGYPILKVRGRAAPAAVEVRSRLESRTGRFLVHFDIGVLKYRATFWQLVERLLFFRIQITGFKSRFSRFHRARFHHCGGRTIL
jgi:hypothetical protein